MIRCRVHLTRSEESKTHLDLVFFFYNSLFFVSALSLGLLERREDAPRLSWQLSPARATAGPKITPWIPGNREWPRCRRRCCSLLYHPTRGKGEIEVMRLIPCFLCFKRDSRIGRLSEPRLFFPSLLLLILLLSSSFYSRAGKRFLASIRVQCLIQLPLLYFAIMRPSCRELFLTLRKSLFASFCRSSMRKTRQEWEKRENTVLPSSLLAIWRMIYCERPDRRLATDNFRGFLRISHYPNGLAKTRTEPVSIAIGLLAWHFERNSKTLGFSSSRR